VKEKAHNNSIQGKKKKDQKKATQTLPLNQNKESPITTSTTHHHQQQKLQQDTITPLRKKQSPSQRQQPPEQQSVSRPGVTQPLSRPKEKKRKNLPTFCDQKRITSRESAQSKDEVK